MKYKNSFKNWLPENDVESVSDYCYYISTIEDKLGIEIEDFFYKAVDVALIRQITARKFKGKDAASSLRSGARKYLNFLWDKRDDVTIQPGKPSCVVKLTPAKKEEAITFPYWYSNVA